MGRKAATFSSPIDSVMEKYHSDIGSRLSGVFPPQTSAELCENFCQLTLDTRHRHSVKIKPTDPSFSPQAFKKTYSLSRKTHKAPTSDASSSSLGGQEPGGKTRLVDRLARALFQKKHMCARCQRRSRSCLPNKSFTYSEKRYTCASCRQQSKAVKKLFEQPAAGQLSSSMAQLTSVPKESTTQSKDRLHHHRTQNTDSGYGTVTSCSTVSSACSTFTNTILSSRSNQSFRHAATAAHDDVSDSSNLDLSSLPQQLHAVDETLSEANSKVSSPVESKNAQVYDGYLPDIDYERLEKLQVDAVRQRTPLRDVTNFEGRTVHNGRVDGQPDAKVCHACEATDKNCFRLPWEGGWLCEDCLDVIH